MEVDENEWEWKGNEEPYIRTLIFGQRVLGNRFGGS